MTTILNSELVSQVDEAPFWHLSRVELRVALAAVLLSLVARWQALLPGYSVDDFHLIQDQGAGLFSQAASQGRLLGYVLWAVLAQLGALPPHSSVFALILLTVVLVATGLAVCRLWGIKDHFAECAIAVSFIALHPYQAEVFTFKATPLFLALPLALSFAALLACPQSRRHWFFSLVAVVCSLALYQVVLNYVAMALLFSLVFHLARTEDLNPCFWRVLRSQVALLLAGVAVYGVFTLAASAMSGVPLRGRAALISLQEIGPRIGVVVRQCKVMFFGAEPILPLATKLLLLLTLLLGLAVYLLSSRRESPRGTVSRRALAFGLALAGGVPLCFGLVLVLGDWWPVPRVLAQTGMFWGGIFALTLHFARPAARRIILAALTVILFSFIGINNQVFNDQLRMNRRDFAKANRIISRLEALPDFTPTTGVVVVGGQWSYRSPIYTVQGDMNISALFAEWSKLPLLNEVSGYNLQPAPPAVVEKAISYCLTAPKWPSAEAVIRLDSFAVVCQEPRN